MKYSLNEEQINGFLNEISNPALRNLFRMMLNNQKQEQENTSPRRITLNKAVEDVKHLLEINKVMRVSLNELKTENEKMVDHYRTLTKALGACECLGENVICPICHGKGVPGSMHIDESGFHKYVYPLLQKITMTVDNTITGSNGFEEKLDPGELSPGKN